MSLGIHEVGNSEERKKAIGGGPGNGSANESPAETINEEPIGKDIPNIGQDGHKHLGHHNVLGLEVFLQQLVSNQRIQASHHHPNIR